MKKNHKVWVVLIAVILVISSSLFFLQTSSVIAMFSNERVAEVLFRVWFDVLPNYNSGHYYQTLIMKHVVEFNHILNDHPEHINEITNVIISFFPVMEAPSGKSSEESRITEEQINDLEYELDWIYFFANPSLREDLDRERERFPLENFIGMTMYEVLEFVDSNWDSIPVAESILLPTAISLPPPTLYFTITPYPTPTCRIGDAPECSKEPSLVTDSAGLWAFEVIDNVYFEYPSDWRVKEPYNPETVLTFIPSLDSFEDLTTKGIFFGVRRNVTLSSKINYSEISCSSDGTFNQTNILLREQIILPDFKGTTIVWADRPSSPTIYIESTVYNKDRQLMVCLITVIDDYLTGQLLTNQKALDEKYPNIQHILESIQIWNE